MITRKLVLCTTAAMAAASGARAADAIVIAEPEPMEYVRICDMYEGEFFYIPGTETCMDIGGYIRYEMRNGDAFDGGDLTKLARFAPNFTVKNETEWGTLTGYAEVEFDWSAGIATTTDTLVVDPVTGDIQTVSATSFGNSTSINLYQAYIQLETASGTLLIGRTDNPYARFLGYAGPTLWEGTYPLVNTGEVSYTYDAGNGFSAILAAVQIEETQSFEPGIEAGANYEADWGSIGAIGGYDTFADSWGARAVARANIATGISATLQVFYSSDDAPGIYHVFDPAGQATEWSVLAGGFASITEKVAVAAVVQWFDTDAWEVSANVPLTPVDGLAITPEVVYQNVDGFDDVWSGRLRFQRSF